MVQITGKYELVKSENFSAYLVGVGLPEDKAKEVDKIKPTYDIKHEGDKICVDVDQMPDLHVEYILNKEIDEKLPFGVTVKTTTVMQGDDTIVMTSKTPKGRTGTRTYKFNGNEVTIVYKDDEPSCPVATRVFKRL
ncbi:fatty acid-binding protein, liver-like [Coccinella septempunctata]|uniref:fatty acid-binding protein, liver-like n=1 Tax=Coccinella septempunctata TaxID=41139 RepID=UPI001D05EA84|nr:fatty acid-binding protein, liver-like [Coccinella septempunctata]